jgi:lysophospholipase L1-like esterase
VTLPGAAVVALVVTAAALAAVVLRLRSRLWRARHPPSTFLRTGRSPGTTAVVVCAGDSLTQGVGSGDFVALLEERFGPRGVVFVNAGVSGNLAWNVRQRLDAIVACRPDVVTLLVGTNDVHATLDARWAERFRRDQGLPAPPSLGWFRENVGAILDRLQSETGARLAVLTIPPIGEDPLSTLNARVRDYNGALAEIAAARGIACLPLHETLVAALPPGHVAPPYDGRSSLMWRAGMKRFVLRRRWDRISAEHGLALLTDHVHLNDTGAAIVAELVGGFLEGTGTVPAARVAAPRAPG